jgi:hypothetical protein
MRRRGRRRRRRRRRRSLGGALSDVTKAAENPR